VAPSDEIQQSGFRLYSGLNGKLPRMSGIVSWCSGGTTVTVTGDIVDAAAQPVITVTVVVTRFNDDQASTFINVSVTSEVCCSSSSIAVIH